MNQFRVFIHNMQDRLGAKNMSNLTIKAIKAICDTKSSKREQIKRHNRYGKELIRGSAVKYIGEDLDFKIIMYSAVLKAVQVKDKLGSNPFDPIRRKEQA